MFRKFNLKQTFAALILSAISMQMLAFTAFAQTDEKREDVLEFSSNQQDENLPQIKIAPDLEPIVDETANGFRADENKAVIIQLKSSTSLNEMFGNNLDENSRRQIFRQESEGNKIRAAAVKTRIQSLRGTFNKSFNNIGLISAEMPLSKIRELSADENIEYISPDRETSMNGHLETTTGTNLVRSLTAGTTIDGRGIGVAVMDSAYYIDNIMFRNSSGAMVSQVNYDTLGINMMAPDGNGHGTHVASLIAGNSAFVNGYYTGVAPGAKIILVRVLDAIGTGRSVNVIAGIDWLIANKSQHNIRVLNMSLGTPAVDSYRTDPLCLAVRRAVNAGIVVVTSAGNNGKNVAGNKQYGGINSPGIEPSAITVGAVNTFGTDARSDDAIASYSSRGPTRGYRTVNGVRRYDNLIKPDLVAPGNKLIGAQSMQNTNAIIPDLIIRYPSLNARPHDLIFDWNTYQITGTKNGTMFLSGTSMAAPVVSGAVALMLQANPKLTPNLVKAILMYSAQPLRNVNTLEQGAGQLNVDGAVKLTKLVKTTLPTTNGSALLSASLPSSQTSTIAGQTVTWGKGVITNHGFLYGNDLMNKWQGMYASGVLVSDSTPFSGTSITRSTTMTSGTLSLFQGAINNNGVLVSDGTLFMNANAMGGSPAAYINSQGVLVSDGVLVGDGVLVSDGVLVGDGNPNWANALFGDNTTGMVSANY